MTSRSRALLRRLLHSNYRGAEHGFVVLPELRDCAGDRAILVAGISPDYQASRTEGARESDRRSSILSSECDILTARVVIWIHEGPDRWVVLRLLLQAH